MPITFIRTGGTHEDGFKRALTRILNSYGIQSKIIKEDKDKLSGEDTREGQQLLFQSNTAILNSKDKLKRN